MFSPVTSYQLRLLKMIGDEEFGLSRDEFVMRIYQKKDKCRTTVYDNLKKLNNKGLAKKSTINNEKRGRSVVKWIITDKGRQFLAEKAEQK